MLAIIVAAVVANDILQIFQYFIIDIFEIGDKNRLVNAETAVIITQNGGYFVERIKVECG